MKYNIQKMSLEVLWIHFTVYGDHDAAIEICDRAIAGNNDADAYAQLIWEKKA